MEKWIEEAVRAVSTDRVWLLILASGLIYFLLTHKHVDELTASFAHGSYWGFSLR